MNNSTQLTINDLGYALTRHYYTLEKIVKFCIENNNIHCNCPIVTS